MKKVVRAALAFLIPIAIEFVIKKITEKRKEKRDQSPETLPNP
ncbi:hypothetical protein [Elizabethkingia anophelis]|uniref:Uncharacterized protein n=1 Tax=Elizabethkingia anophelis TaxID=1117645 RepID=A0A7Z7LTK6_9FLAO|nr:hypothetical protein [Elizabethkingia anophelis]WGL70403.1 hypothetical protein QFB79_03370 [Elizabethkingia anophelis]STC96713.1 Uncharacterised protein [Elizabethkingia anophelis]